jgi:hypothetical protein
MSTDEQRSANQAGQQMNDSSNQAMPKTFEEWHANLCCADCDTRCAHKEWERKAWNAATAAAQAEIAGLREKVILHEDAREHGIKVVSAALRAKDEEIARLAEAAENLAWATETEIKGDYRTRSFKIQHRNKCQHWITEVRRLTAQAEKEKSDRP